MKGRAGQGAKKLGSVWWDFLKKQDSYLHLFGVRQEAASIWEQDPASPKWPCRTSLRYNIFWQGPGEQSLLSAPLPVSGLCSPLDAKLILYLLCYVNEIPKHFQDPLRPAKSLLCVRLVSCSVQSLSNLLGFIFTFLFQAMQPGPHRISFTVEQLLCSHLYFFINCFISSQHCVETHRKETSKKSAHCMDCFDILISPHLSTVLENEGQWCESISVKS